MSNNKKEIAEVIELSMSDVTNRLTEIENSLASILTLVQGLQSGKKAPTTKKETTKKETPKKETPKKETTSAPAKTASSVPAMLSVWFKKNFAKNDKFRNEFLENPDVKKLVEADEFTDSTDKDNLKKMWNSFSSHGKEKATKTKAIPEIQKLYKEYKEKHEKLKE